MKKFVLVLLIALGACLLAAGCSSGTSGSDLANPAAPADASQNAEPPSDPAGEPTAGGPAEAETDDGGPAALPQPGQPDETASGQRQFVYDLAELDELPTYSLQDLFAFYQGADGAFAEGAMAEIMERFCQEPGSFLSALAGEGQELQDLIAGSLGVSIFFSGEYQDQLYDARSLGLDEQQSTLLESIIAAYESSASSLGVMAETAAVEPADEDLVLIPDYIPSIYIDLKYAAEDNFTGTVIYDFTDASLRYGTVKKLAEVQEELLGQGYSLKVWDAYRPVSAQFRLWEACPDAAYVANPNTGYSSHSRGSTVDVTMVMADGTQIAMPSGFDDFSALADRDYSDVSDDAAKNALILEGAMAAHGFTGYSAEWWHYSDSVSYPVIEE